MKALLPLVLGILFLAGCSDVDSDVKVHNETDQEITATVTVHNDNGKEVYREQITAASQTIAYGEQKLKGPTGVYTIEAQSGEHSATQEYDMGDATPSINVRVTSAGITIGISST